MTAHAVEAPLHQAGPVPRMPFIGATFIVAGLTLIVLQHVMSAPPASVVVIGVIAGICVGFGAALILDCRRPRGAPPRARPPAP